MHRLECNMFYSALTYLNSNNNSGIIEGQLNAKVTGWVFLKKSKRLNEEIIIKLHIKCSIYARNV